MKHIFTISLCFLALSLSAQETITYPYNPDGDADGLVAVPDIQDLLAVYGSPFSPAEIMVGDTALSEWIQILYQALQDQQEVIEAMQGAGGCNFNYPDGLVGESIFHDFVANGAYAVPAGKNLYTNLIFHNTGNDVLINSMIIHDSGELKHHLNIVLSEGDSISITNNAGNTPTCKKMFGLLVDKKVQSVTHDFMASGPYTVPVGKNLYIYKIHAGHEVAINSSELITSLFNQFNNQMINHIILSAGDIIDVPYQTDDGYENMFGYLTDEDYFADCGGGGSGGVSVSTFGDTLTVNGESVIVPGISFPNVVPTFGSVTDASGNTYQTVKYGNEEFMTEDLNSSHWSDGTLIPENCFPGTNTNSMNETPGWCYYNNNSSSAYAYGKLYNGWLVGDSRNACPVGWHIATTQEWEAVLDLFGDYNGSEWEQSGERLKSDILWNGTNESFMSLVPGGQNNNGSGDSGGSYGIYWTGNVTQVSGGNWTMVDLLQVSSNSDNVNRSWGADWGYHAIRCKKN